MYIFNELGFPPYHDTVNWTDSQLDMSVLLVLLCEVNCSSCCLCFSDQMYANFGHDCDIMDRAA